MHENKRVLNGLFLALKWIFWDWSIFL